MSSSSNEDIAIKAEGRSAPPPYEEVATPPNGQADGVNSLGKQDSGVRIDDFGASLERSPEELAVVRKLDMYCLVRGAACFLILADAANKPNQC